MFFLKPLCGEEHHDDIWPELHVNFLWRYLIRCTRVSEAKLPGHLTKSRTRFPFLDTLLVAHSESQPIKNSEVTWEGLPRFIGEQGREEGLELWLQFPKRTLNLLVCMFVSKESGWGPLHGCSQSVDLHNIGRDESLSRREFPKTKQKKNSVFCCNWLSLCSQSFLAQLLCHLPLLRLNCPAG